MKIHFHFFIRIDTRGISKIAKPNTYIKIATIVSNSLTTSKKLKNEPVVPTAAPSADPPPEAPRTEYNAAAAGRAAACTGSHVCQLWLAAPRAW